MNSTHYEENTYILLAALLNFTIPIYVKENPDLSWDVRILHGS